MLRLIFQSSGLNFSRALKIFSNQIIKLIVLLEPNKMLRFIRKELRMMNDMFQREKADCILRDHRQRYGLGPSQPSWKEAAPA